MSRETASRDVKLNVLAAFTGGLTAVAFVGTGLATGMAAHYTAQKAVAKAQSKAAPAQNDVAAPPSVEPPLPIRTVVTTRFVQAKAPAAQGTNTSGGQGTQGSGAQRATGSVARRPTHSRQSSAGTSVRSTSRSAAAPAPARAPAPVAVRSRAVAPAPSAAS